MSLEGKTLKVCSCNRTLPLDAKALAAALKSGEPLTVHDQLCRKDAGAYQAALGGADDVIVACTQEATLFEELAASSSAKVSFVNIRELGGWSAEKSTPKLAALLAAAALPEAEPAPAVEFQSTGQVLIVGPAAAALDWAARLAGQLEVSVLATDASGELPLERKFPVWSCTVQGMPIPAWESSASTSPVSTPRNLPLCSTPPITFRSAPASTALRGCTRA